LLNASLYSNTLKKPIKNDPTSSIAEISKFLLPILDSFQKVSSFEKEWSIKKLYWQNKE